MKLLSRLPVFGLKLLLIAVCIAGAFMSVNRSRVVILTRTNPEAALGVDPSYAPAALMMGNLLYAQDQKGAVERRIGLARLALRDEPLAADAIRQIGLARDAGRVVPETRRFMRLADERSRRDGLAQIWLAQDRFKAGDQLGAMAQIDTVMRVNREAQGQLFPLLARFANAPGISDALASRSDAGAAWVADYMLYLLAKGSDRTIIADILLAIDRPDRLREGANIATETARELAVAGNGGRARSVFFHAVNLGLFGPDRSRIAAPWRLFNHPGVAADWRKSGARRFLDVLVDAGASGTVAQQVRFDKSAPRWQLRLIDPRMPPGSQLTLAARCGPNSPSVIVWAAFGTVPENRPIVRRATSTPSIRCDAPVYSMDASGPRDHGSLAVSVAGIDMPEGGGR